ncbi:glucosamine-6-phosphate deaminase [candidate division KSB1 bacterium]|nr:glucosamine-6-phosphate deaminase [candidate division KSB1 bacterium]
MSQKTTLTSKVEEKWLEKSGRKLIYPKMENIAVIEVDNFPSLGKFAALRFIEWVLANPGGVISLPTGKTPEHFIKWVTYYLKNWNLPQVKTELENNGINPSKTPDMKSLHFVQIDEFYPIDPTQTNSFYYYVNKFYIKGFNLDPSKALLIDVSRIGLERGEKITDIFPDEYVDLTLRTRQPNTRFENRQKEFIMKIDQWCSDYEEKIRKLGGIGFFLGGIGPDGHIGFNVLGSDHHSTTRLTPTNYETQAAAASDLGGIEIARKRLVITIGLATITHNRDAVAIIIAAGEAKARVIYNAVQMPRSNLYPATVLHDMPNARLYLTKGAAHLLTERVYIDIKEAAELSPQTVERVIIDLALDRRKKLVDLTADDFKSIRSAAEVLKRSKEKLADLTARIERNLIEKIEQGREDIVGKSFMHMGPHHDDIMLGYLPYIVHLVRPTTNTHTFNYATSGFNAVTNLYVLGMLQRLKEWIVSPDSEKLLQEDYFRPDYELGRSRDVYQYLDGIAAHSRTMKTEGECRRLLRILVFLFEENSIAQLTNRIDELINYFSTQYPGKKDLPYIQQLKGMIREWEADLLWGYFGFNTQSVNHIRMGFYKGEIFTEQPELERDVRPILSIMESQQPDIVSVALDPEGSGPDTHYKVLQATMEAVKIYQDTKPDVKIFGYRNVWYRFHPSDVNIVVPVSLNSMAILDNAFMNCFGSQKEASFPSYEYDGPFFRLAQRIMVEQYQMLKTCLGRDYFYSHESPRMRAAHGLIFLKSMNVQEFMNRAAELRKSME